MLTSGLPVVYVPNINIISKSIVGGDFKWRGLGQRPRPGQLIESVKIILLKVLNYKHTMFIWGCYFHLSKFIA